MQKEYPPCTLHQVSEHIWWFTPEARTDRPSLAAVVGANDVALLDIGASPKHTQQFLSMLAEQGIAAPHYAVLTHWHWDHSFGMAALGCPTIAHLETAQNIERMMSLDYCDANLPILIADGHEVPFTTEHMVLELTDENRKQLHLHNPAITFSDELRLNLGGVHCQIHHVGGDHAADSVVIYIPEDKVLFLGDCFYYTVYEEPQHYTQEKILALIDTLAQFKAEVFVQGHSNVLVSRQQMTSWFELIRDVYALLEQHGHDQLDTVRKILHQKYDAEDVTDFLAPIIAGINLA